MGGHHQEDQVVDDVSVGEPVPVGVDGMAEHGEHVGAVAVASLADPLREVLLQHFSSFQSAPPLERRDGRADDCAAGPGGGGERLVHLRHEFAVSAGLVSHEHHRGDVEGEFLGRGMEQESRVVRRPVVGHHRCGDAVDVLDVTRQSGAGEGLLHDPAVEHVLVEVEQHQSPVEERPDHRYPCLLREVLGLVGVDRLGGVRPQRGHGVERRRLRVVDGTVAAVHLQQIVRPAAEDLDQVAQDRQTGVAHHRLEAAARRGFGQDELRPLLLAQPCFDRAHAGDRVQRGGEPAAGLVEQVVRCAGAGHRCS